MRLGEWDGREKDREYEGRGVDEIDSGLWKKSMKGERILIMDRVMNGVI